MLDFARKITSQSRQGPPRSWHTARIRRFAALRHTAFPSLLPATKAARPGRSCCFSCCTTINVRYGVCNRLPCVNREEISALDFIVSNPEPLLHAKALASLSAASSENGATALRRHAGTETVALGALAGIGLIGALHGHFPFNTLKSNLQSIYHVRIPSSIFNRSMSRSPQPHQIMIEHEQGF